MLNLNKIQKAKSLEILLSKVKSKSIASCLQHLFDSRCSTEEYGDFASSCVVQLLKHLHACVCILKKNNASLASQGLQHCLYLFPIRPSRLCPCSETRYHVPPIFLVNEIQRHLQTDGLHVRLLEG